jgi:3-oxoacyl-[acyl-carrier-protein] synthase II
MDARDARRSDRFCQMALASAVMAVDQARWDGLPYDAHRIGVVVGSGTGGLATLEAQHSVLRDRGPNKLSPFAVPLLMINGAAGAISMRYQITGPSFAPVSACATAAPGSPVRRARSAAVRRARAARSA